MSCKVPHGTDCAILLDYCVARKLILERILFERGTERGTIYDTIIS